MELIVLLIPLAVAVWVSRDARRRNMAMPGLWAVFVFLILIVGLPTYLIVDTRHPKRGSFPPIDMQRAVDMQRVPPPSGLPPAGWYPDPSGSGGERWWDGRGWSPQAR